MSEVRQPTRAELIEELRILEDDVLEKLNRTAGCYTKNIAPAKQKRIREIDHILDQCKCRNCHKIYNRMKSRADWTGFCSIKCQHEKARKLGYRKRKSPDSSEYKVLSSRGAIGSDFVCK